MAEIKIVIKKHELLTCGEGSLWVYFSSKSKLASLRYNNENETAKTEFQIVFKIDN